VQAAKTFLGQQQESAGVRLMEKREILDFNVQSTAEGHLRTMKESK